jgi:hypothetical protein
MSMATLDSPAVIMGRLQDIEADLADRQNTLEAAAMNWYRAKRDKEHKHAVTFISATGTVAERTQQAALEASLIGKEEEALFEALRAVVRTLETRATIGMALLKSQSRIGS